MNLVSRVLTFSLLGCLGVLATAPAFGQSAPAAPRFQASFEASTARMRQALGTDAFPALRKPAASRYDVVALRVEFQPDTTRFTTGDGTFGGTLYPDGLAPSVDPLPHDADYFQAHLDFLEDYVGRVSDGQTTVTTHLVPEIVRLPKEMGAYSPTGPEANTDAELLKMARFVTEAWRTADAQSSFDLAGFDPDRTAFVLFHAGVGRDVELIGTTLDKTPQDLPSLYFDTAALRRLGETPPQFNGVTVENTLILPRTETRPGFNFIADLPFLAEFSINGLLAASFFNYLGVPDLFDTETGESAIGPFGLMDPLGIFAFNGLFPPEPSAWTKYFLGWLDPLDLTGDGPTDVTLRAATFPDASEAARVFITDAEYFLVETRHRDPEGDGVVLRVWRDGQVVEESFPNGDPDFNRFVIEGFGGGVVVGVDHYDFALPGGLDEDDNALLGGMVIWHVDERRFRANFAANRVNADPARRALAVEEADSGPDLGFPSGSFFGPSFDLGTPFDFWYENNPVVVLTPDNRELRLYQNRFGPDTFPPSDANEGGASFIVLDGFTAPAPTMSFTYRREAAEGITPLTDFTEPINAFLGGFDATFDAGGSLTPLTRNDGDLVLFLDAGPAREGADLFAVGAEPQQSFGANTAFVTPAVLGGGIHALTNLRVAGLLVTDGENADSEVFAGVDAASFAPSSPLVVVSDGGEEGLFFLLDGALTQILTDDTAGARLVTVDTGPYQSIAAVDAARIAKVGTNGVEIDGLATTHAASGWTYALPSDATLGQAVFGRDAGGIVGLVPVPSEGVLLFLTPDGDARRIDLPTRFGAGTLSSFPVLADLDGDARLDVLATYGETLVAFSQGGGLVEDFPLALAAPSVAQPLVAQRADGEGVLVFVATTDGQVYAFDFANGGDQLSGFPLAVGLSVKATPLLHEKRLYALSEEGSLRAWEIDALGPIRWGRLYGNVQNQSFAALAFTSPPVASETELLDEAETYNWPNPIREGRTHLRFRPSRPSVIRITIIDAAGRLVDEIDVGSVPGGVPSEHRWETDAPSGLYFARITATADDGSSASKLVKMAIIR